MRAIDETTANVNDYDGLQTAGPLAELADATDSKSTACQADNSPTSNKLSEGISPPSKRRTSKTARVYTYLVQAFDGGPIKIGRTIDVAKRISLLQCGNPKPLRLLTVQEGDREHALHMKFAQYRTTGEWFISGPEIIDWIRLSYPSAPDVGVELSPPWGWGRRLPWLKGDIKRLREGGAL